MNNLINGVFLAVSNPFMETIIDILNDIKGWLLGVIGVITVVVVVRDAIKYQGGTTDEKNDAVKAIRNHIIWGAGIFVLVWLATYIIGRFQSVDTTSIENIIQCFLGSSC